MVTHSTESHKEPVKPLLACFTTNSADFSKEANTLPRWLKKTEKETLKLS